MLPKRLLFSALKRITLGISAIAATAWLLWPNETFSFKPDAAIATITAIFAWIAYEFQETFDQNVNISDHDIELYSNVIELFNKGVRIDLDQHDFGNAFEYDFVKPIHHAADTWNGSDFEFDDGSLEEVFSIMKLQVKYLSNHIAMNTFSTDHDAMIFSFKTEIDKHGVQKRTWDKIKAANDGASKFSTSLDNLIKRYRKIASISKNPTPKKTAASNTAN